MPLPLSVIAAPRRNPRSRRDFLAALPALAGVLALPVHAQNAPLRPTSGPPLVIAQLADMSPQQQDVSRDFLAGARAAWQDINLRGGVQGRPVQHRVIELDGSSGALQKAWQSVRGNGACVALSGTTGHAMASELAEQMRKDALAGDGMAHVAPWLQNSGAAVDAQTFPIFAGRQEQITHAIRSLSVVGIAEVGVVYANAQDHAQYRADVERTAASLKLALRSVQLDPTRSAAPAHGSLPAIVLFVGGTPELLQFCQSLARQAASRQQFVVALADVNVQTLAQAGMPRSTPVIAVQPVPVVTASLPVVRSYRETLARLFDEAPTPQSLAGFIAARYTFMVMDAMTGPLTRSNVLAAFSRRNDVDVGGYRVSFNAQRRGSSYVTQSMLTPDGRQVG